MRIVSLVPSMTETLLFAGVQVVGRSRYCIHPEAQVAGIPKVGGTKDWDWPAIQALQPDLVILDQEENPKFMSEQREIPFFATHITSLDNVAPALTALAERLSAPRLRELSARWRRVALWPGLAPWQPGQELPGVLNWGRHPHQEIQQVLYMIWRNPWMTVSHDTFIGSVLQKCGISVPSFATRYPQIELESYPREQTLLLFSSEPYPFGKHQQRLREIANPYALVNGEMFSWFGLRSLQFLEELQSR
jgi:iron complex transport system substrate-binding protein